MALFVQVHALLDNEWTSLLDDEKNNTFVCTGYPYQFDDTLDETFDKCTFESLNERMELYPRYMPLRFSVTDDNGHVFTRYYLGNDTVKVWRFLEPKYYLHKFECIELTHMLTRYFVYGKAFTQPIDGSVRYYLDDVVDILLDTTPLHDEGVNPIFKLDENVRAKLHNATPTEFQWSNRVTLYEVLQDVGRVINGIPRLIPNKDNDMVYDTITFDFYDEDRGEYEEIVWNDYESFSNAEYCCQELVTSAENMTTDRTVVVPSKDGWVGIRNDTVKYQEDDTAYIDTILPVEKFTRVLMRVKDFDVDVWYKKSDLNTKWTPHAGKINGYVDITGYVWNKSSWEVLDRDRKNCSLYYTKGGNRIENVGALDDKWLFKSPVISNIYKACFDKFVGTVTIEFNTDDVITLDVNDSQLKDMVDAAKITPGNLELRMEFIPAPNSAVCVTKKDVNTGVGQMAYNQSGELVNASRLGKNAQSAVNRLGNDEIFFTETHDTVEKLPVVGQRYKDCIITNVSYQLTDYAHWLVLMQLSKNYVRVNEYRGIDRKYRQFAIPQEIIQRSIHKDILIEISNENKKCINNIAPLIVNFFVLGFGLQANNLIIKPNNLTALMPPTAVYEYGDTLIYSAKTRDNLAIGRKIVDKQNYDVNYCYADGTLDKCKLYITNINNVDKDRYPEVNEDSSDFKYSLIKKDPAEQLSFEIQYHFKSDNDIILNPKFFLKYMTVEELTIQMRKLNGAVNKDTIVNNSNSEIIDKDIDMEEVNGAFIIKINNLPNSGAGYALCDDNGMILFARNVDLSTLDNNSDTLFVNSY